MSPALALGSVVHEVLEELSVVASKDRFTESLLTKFDLAWEKVSGKKGGFFSAELEEKYRKRGKEMIERVISNPGPLKNLAVKIDMDLPYYWLSEEENIILCGKIDWLEYLPESDGVNIIDFKTSKREEAPGSLQLPIYCLLVDKCQSRKTEQVSYWYLELDKIVKQKMPDLKKSEEKILKIARKIKLARQLKKFDCPNGKRGCRACRDFEEVLAGKAEFVGADDMGRDAYVLKPKEEKENREGKII